MRILECLDEKVSYLDEAKKGEEAREAARRIRLEQENDFEAVQDSITAELNRLAMPVQGYRVSGSRPEFHDPNIPWQNNLQRPSEIRLPTNRHPTADEVKQWRKNELMRYFVKLIRESAIFKEYRTLVEAADKFSKMLEERKLPLQIQTKSKHRKGDRITHPEDWILAFDKSSKGKAIYLDRGNDSLQHWWRGTENDPERRPWRHVNYRS